MASATVPTNASPSWIGASFIEGRTSILASTILLRSMCRVYLTRIAMPSTLVPPRVLTVGNGVRTSMAKEPT